MSSPIATPFEVLTRLVAEKAQVDPNKVRASSRLIDFGLDSVRAMEIIAELEEIYELPIPDQDLMEIETLQDIARYIQRRRDES